MQLDCATYACGNDPRVGDLVSFGTRHKEYIVTSIDEDTAGGTVLRTGQHSFEEYSLKVMKLLARHGETRK